MKRILSKLLVLLSFCMMIGMVSEAKDLRDEKPDRLENITGMDEEGNVTELDPEEIRVEDKEEQALSSKAAENTLVVNFRRKADGTEQKDTTSYEEFKTNTEGYVSGVYGSDAAYLGKTNGKVKFMISGVIGLVDEKKVSLIEKSKTKSLSYYYVSGGDLLHRISLNVEKDTVSTINNGTAPSYLKSGVNYYSYDGHYFYTDYADMIADYKAGDRSGSVNEKNPYYNYFQYLPLRSKSQYTENQLNTAINNNPKVTSKSKMRNAGAHFVKYQNTYGVNALIMTGIAANESAWGTSPIAQNKNNLFGLNAVDSSPGESANYFKSVQQCIEEFSEKWMSKEYLNPNVWKYFGGFLGNKASGINVKYASDPYWGEKAAALAWNLDSLNGKKDVGRYTIGIKGILPESNTNENVYRENSTSSTKFYKTGNVSNYAVLLMNPKASNSFYKIQSDAVLDRKREKVNPASGVYSVEHMYAYIPVRNIKVVNKGVTISTTDKPFSPDWVEYEPDRYGDVKKSTKLLAEPKEGEVLATIPSGKRVLLDGYEKLSDGSWYRTTYDGKVGYVLSTDLKLSYQAYDPDKTGTTTANLYMRSGVGLNYTKKSYIKSGSKITLYGYYRTEGYDWYYINYNGEKGYISSKYVVRDEKEKPVWVGYDTKKYGEVQSDTKLRKTSEADGDVLATLKKGERILMEGYDKYQSGSFYKTNYNGKTGYVSAEDVKLSYQAYDPDKTGTTTANLYMRSGVGLNYTKKSYIKSGSKITLYGYYRTEGYDWYYINYNGEKGYISSKYVVRDEKEKPVWVGYDTKKYGDVQSDTKLRKTSEADGDVLATLKKGERILLEGYDKYKSGSFYKTIYNGKTGYVSAKDMKLSYQAYDPDKTGTTTANLYMRSGVGLNYTKKSYIKSGSKITLYGYYRTEGYDWYYVNYNGEKGYVSSKYVKRSDSL